MAHGAQRFIARFSIAGLAIFLAIIIRLLLDPALADNLPMTALLFAVAFSVWKGGVEAGLLAVLLGTLAGAFFLLHPRGSFCVAAWENQVRLGVFFSLGICLSFLGQPKQNVQLDLEARAPTKRETFLAAAADQERTQAILRESESRFRALVEQSIVGFYVIQDERYAYVNPKLSDILGYPPEDITSRPLVEFIAPADRAIVAENIRKRLTGEIDTVHYQLGMCHRDGRVIQVEAHGTRTEYRGKSAILGVCIDVTEQLKNKETLERLAALVSSSADAIIAVTPEGTVTDWNNGAEQMFGYTAPEALGRSILMLVPTAEHASADEILEGLRRGAIMPAYETARKRKDGGTVTVSVRLSRIKHQGRLTGFSVIYRDLTNTKKLEEQLRQAQKMEAIGQLAGGIAHDFNNLLTVISGYSELLLRRFQPDDPDRALIEEVYNAGERAALLTRQLLAFSRKQVIEPRVLDLNAIVTGTEKMLSRLIGEDIRLSCTIEPRLSLVKVDPGQVEQVIMNLAINARDAMPEGGHLTIETANVVLDENYARLHAEVKPGRYVMLAVSDTGLGMDAATKARVFEPFFTTKGPGRGTGLGLAMVHGIVKQSEGHIGVYSELGRGTTFKVYFPAVGEEATIELPRAGFHSTLRGTETILVVEDEPAVRSLARLALQTQGYVVLEATHGDEALRIGAEYPGPIHLLLTDVVMPGMNGRQVAELLRPRRSAMKVLYLSGYTDDAVVRHGILQANTAFLQKPFTPATLARKVREVLGDVH